jgi:DNA-binding Lrp family transcriptional regulator
MVILMADKPCCPADALRRIRQVEVNGIITGITMLDESIAEVKELRFTDEREIREALMKRVKIYNYIPPGVADAYAEAIMKEYHTAKKRG